MREILFKGKRLNNGQWVEGNYGFFKSVNGNEKMHHITTESGKAIRVDPTTLCQFTGITDKNGNKIWENDIALTQEFYDKPYAKNRKSKKHIGIVKYDIYSGNFYNNETGKHDKRKEYDAKWSIKVKNYGKFIHSSWGDFFDCEVIGNVFDNPELLT